ncbi:MAG TPA: arginine deiminase-related protein [Steroidobacteraceae bacterium]|nr:arginine deiminase-related protein [Steroidobacteraceae bacterium]
MEAWGQCADAVLMVEPKAFGFNPDTARTNAFQHADANPAAAEGVAAGGATQALALAEFRQLARALESEGVAVCAVPDTAAPVKPDAVFPNNWVSFHQDGTLVLYPMQSPSRRPERRQDVIESVIARLGFKVAHLLDLTHFEGEGMFLEGTGSLVLDHAQRVAYACASPRTHPALVAEWAQELDYEPVVFQAADAAGVPLYHTNVLMWIGERVALVGTAAIAAADRERVLGRLRASGREVLEIGQGEIAQFAGNMLELGTWDEALGDSRVLVMSETARRSLTADSYARLSGCTDAVLAVPIPTIERLGGGSVRCMLAEVFGRT